MTDANIHCQDMKRRNHILFSVSILWFSLRMTSHLKFCLLMVVNMAIYSHCVSVSCLKGEFKVVSAQNFSGNMLFLNMSLCMDEENK